MCVRNGEKLIRSAVESLTKQDFPHEKMQIVFVDDGSKDHTFQIIREFASRTDIQVKTFQTEEQGLGPARNLIASNTDGEYIIWVDADQILPKSFVREQIEFMERNPDVGITVGIPETVPGNLVLSLELVPLIVVYTTYGQPTSFLWKTRKLPGTGGATFRTKALKQVNGFDDRITGVGEDQDVAQRVRDAGWLIRINSSRFCEFHGGMSTFTDLWRKYLWYGYGHEKVYRQNRELFSFLRMSPMAGILTGLFYSLIAYKVTHKKMVFLLPFQYGIKMTAWMFGFMKGQVCNGKEQKCHILI
jgi:glycosyltransferase involved in cell wall biosynthesis